jgi:xylulokinase
MHGSVFLDAHHRVIRPALLWCDARTVAEVEQMRSLLSRDLISNTLLNPLLAGLTAPKLLWLKNVEPKNYAQLKTLLLPKDYIRLLMTGELGTEESDASGTLLFNVKTRRWAGEVVTSLDLDPDILPSVGRSVDIAGQLTASAANNLGIPASTPVIHGGGDAVMAAIGTGIVESGRALSVIGTGGNVTVFSDEPVGDPKVRLNVFCNAIPNKWIQLGVQQCAGNSLRWLRDNLILFEQVRLQEKDHSPYAVFSEEAGKVKPGSDGLIFLPYLMGERTPHLDPYARGVFFGISNHHDRRHLARAVMEGVIFSFRDAIDIVRENQIPVRTVRATGGGARSPFWTQMQADMFNCPVETLRADEGSGYGAALLAAVSTGMFPNVSDAVRATVQVANVHTPNPRNVEIYNELFGEYRALYSALKDRYANLYHTMEKIKCMSM